MEEELSFEELYDAYLSCLKRKKNKKGTYNFVNHDLCKNLISLLDSLNNKTYTPKSSDCYVITDPALREIFAADFSDRVVQHFYMNKINNILESELVDGCYSCRIGKGTDYALKLLKNYNCRKFIFTYVNKIIDKFKFISFDNLLLKFRLV